MLVFFKDGPFAWNGVMAFWMVVVGYCLWTVFMSVVMLQASHRLEQAGDAEDIGGEQTRTGHVEIQAMAADLAALREEVRAERRSRDSTPPV
jgi:hypothetical protein